MLNINMPRKGRHKKVRYIQIMPQSTQFSPRGKPGRPDEVELNLDHFEALKLADHQGYNQSEGARAMGISRPTFGRILRAGRKIVADALANGKMIRIRTGDVQVGVRHKNFLQKLEKPEDLRARTVEQTAREGILSYDRDLHLISTTKSA